MRKLPQEHRRVFLDANVLVAIGLRPEGRYARIFGINNVLLVTSEHILAEVAENMADLGLEPSAFLGELRKQMTVTDQFVKLPRGLPLEDDEDRQALAEAIGANCDEFITFNSNDFSELYGTKVYGVLVRHSAEFVRQHLQSTHE